MKRLDFLKLFAGIPFLQNLNITKSNKFCPEHAHLDQSGCVPDKGYEYCPLEHVQEPIIGGFFAVGTRWMSGWSGEVGILPSQEVRICSICGVVYTKQLKDSK